VDLATTEVAGVLPDANVANDLTASNYLPLAGGTMTGNIVMPNAGTIGQAAGPLLTFDDTNNELELAGAELGIGTNAPDTMLHLSDTVGNAAIRLERNDTVISSNEVYGAIQFEGQDASTNAAGVRMSIVGLGDTTAAGSGGGALQFNTAQGGVLSPPTERMRIDSSGRVSIGWDASTFSANATLEVVGDFMVSSSEALVTGGDRFTVTTSGNVGIGTTSPVAKLHVSGVEASDGSAVRLANTTASTGKTWKMISKDDGSAEIVLVGSPDKRIAWLKAK
jgi:hypothetical protein